MNTSGKTPMSRDEDLARLRHGRFDVVVIGGGITGCGVALDAASRGLQVALLERNDFSSGTSSRSSKLIHGGLRYLRQLQFKVTLEASREKSLLKKLAPHLIGDRPFLLPYRNKAARPLVATGLWIYDAAAGFPKGLIHKHLDADATLAALPGLQPEGLRGSYLYYDGQTDDCRLVMHVAKKARDLGAVLVNYLPVTGLLRSRGRVAGVKTRDFEIFGDRVVNATGVWCDEIRTIDQGAIPPLVRASKGVHLIVPARRLGLKETAVVLQSPADRRIVFLIPHEGQVIVGTTDTDYRGDLDHPRAEADDIDYLLGLVNENLTAARLRREDVTSSYAGLRPLLLDDSDSPSAASREHCILESPSGLITVTGGKLTTYRLMSRQVVDRLSRAKSRTHRIELFATDASDPLSRRYGSEAAAIVDRKPLSEGTTHVWGEVDYAVDREQARTLTDVMSRRMRLALYAEDRGRSLAEPVARRMAPRLGWDRKEILRQVEAYERGLEENHPR